MLSTSEVIRVLCSIDTPMGYLIHRLNRVNLLCNKIDVDSAGLVTLHYPGYRVSYEPIPKPFILRKVVNPLAILPDSIVIDFGVTFQEGKVYNQKLAGNVLTATIGLDKGYILVTVWST